MSSVQRVKSYDSTPVPFDVRGVLGAALSADWRAALAARGFGWMVCAGSLSTPIVGGGNGTVLDADQPEMVVDVPSGYTMIPTRLLVACQIPLGAADSDESEIAVLVDRTAVSGAVAANGTVTTPTNMRSDILGGTCPLRCVTAVTTNLTAAPTASVDLAHAVRVFETKTDVGTTWGELSLLYQPDVPPFLVGPATFVVYWGGTVATTGFGTLDFLAIPSALVTGLA